MKIRSIKKKITLRIVLIGMATFLLSLIVSYFAIIPFLRDSAIEKAEKANTEIIQQFDILLSYVEDYTENLVLSVENTRKILNYFTRSTEQNSNIASLNLNNLVSYEGVVRCVIIENDEGILLDSLNKITEADYQVISSEWYQSLHNAEYGRGFSGVYQTERNNRTYYSAAYLKNFYYNNHLFTYTVFFDMNDVIFDTQVVAGNTLDYYMLVDATQNVFYSLGPAEWRTSMGRYISDDFASGKYMQESDGISFKKTSINSKWYIISFMSESTIFMLFQNYVVSIVLIMLLFLIITLIFLPRVLAGIIKPISNLSSVMATATLGNLDCQVDITSNDEVGELSRSFNKMLKDLKKSILIISEKEKLEQKIKYSLLVSQIDPHFIYNTINSINYLARKGRCDDIIIVNSALIYILQDRLRVNDIQITDTIEKEMKVVEQYVLIQKYMYEGNLKLSWFVEDSLLDEQIPKNMIQPLVENAIFHGLIDEENGNISGKIDIYIEKKDDDIIVRAKDNGKGIENNKLLKLQTSMMSFQSDGRGKNIGLSNIRGRLYYLFGKSDCLQIESEPGKGTCITLRFKAESKNKNNKVTIY